MRVAIFVRVSSDEQVGSDRVSLDAQERQCREAAGRRGWEVSHVFRAEGESAYTDNLAKRPTMLAAITAAEAHEFDVLMVHESSRFARNTVLATQLRGRLKAANVRLSDVNDFMDTGGADGQFMATVTDGMQQWYSAKIGEHIRKARRELFDLGYHTADVPFGYARETPGVAKSLLVVVPEEAAAIRELFALRAEGWSVNALTDRLNTSGLKPHSKLGRAKFTVSSVCSLIENQFYFGIISYKGERKPGLHEPILTRAEWVAAQPKARPGRGVDPHRGTRALLTGLARCSACGEKLWLGGNSRYKYCYQERSHARGGECPNANTGWWVQEPDAVIENMLKTLTFDREWLAYLNKCARNPQDSTRSLRAKLKAERDRLVDLYVTDGMSREEYDGRVAVLDQRLAELPASTPVVLSAVQELKSMSELWETLPAERRGHYARSFLDSVTLDTRARDVGSIAVQPLNHFSPLFDLRRDFVSGREHAAIGVLPPGGFGGNTPITSRFTVAELGLAA